MSKPPYKKRRVEKALARQEGGGSEPSFTIEIADGPAVPRPDDPGLYLAWRIALAGAIFLMFFLCVYDYLTAWLISVFPGLPGVTWLGRLAESGNFIAGWIVEKAPWLGDFGWLRHWAEEGGRYRESLKFIIPEGPIVTGKITLYSILVVLPLGTIVGLCRVSKIMWINVAASVYVEVVRGIPLLVQFFFIYFAIGNMITIPPMVTAVMALSFCYGAYMGEVVRSGIQAIDRGQTEAAVSLGFTNFQTMTKVVLPQAVRTILPPVGNECIALLKDTSMVSILAMRDILRMGREFASTNYYYFEAYTMAALSYLLITLVLSKLVSLSETHMSRYERR